MVTIKINDVIQQYEEGTSLLEVISKEVSFLEGIAVALNQEVITKKQWSGQILKDQDSILVVKASQGG